MPIKRSYAINDGLLNGVKIGNICYLTYDLTYYLQNLIIMALNLATHEFQVIFYKKCYLKLGILS